MSLKRISTEQYKDMLTDQIRCLSVELFFISTYPQDVVEIRSNPTIEQKNLWTIVSNSYEVQGFRFVRDFKRNNKNLVLIEFFGYFEHGGVLTKIFNEKEIVIGRLYENFSKNKYEWDFSGLIPWKDQLESLKQLPAFKYFDFSELEFHIPKYIKDMESLKLL